MSVDRVRDGVMMTRRWSYLIFPSSSGTLTIPPLVSSTFDPALQQRKELRCAAATLSVQQATAATPQTSARSRAAAHRSQVEWLWAALIAIALLIIALCIKPLHRAIEIRREVQRIVGSSDVRAAVHGIVDEAVIANEASDRGDAYRALRSLLDAIDRNRVTAFDPQRELEARVRDLVQSIR